MEKEVIKAGDYFTYRHPKYPNSSIIGKVMIAGSVTDTQVEKKDVEGELVIRLYPIEFCTKVKPSTLVHYRPFTDNRNVRCLNGAANINTANDVKDATCPLCKTKRTKGEYWSHFEERHGNVGMKF